MSAQRITHPCLCFHSSSLLFSLLAVWGSLCHQHTLHIWILNFREKNCQPLYTKTFLISFHKILWYHLPNNPLQSHKMISRVAVLSCLCKEYTVLSAQWCPSTVHQFRSGHFGVKITGSTSHTAVSTSIEPCTVLDTPTPQPHGISHDHGVVTAPFCHAGDSHWLEVHLIRQEQIEISLMGKCDGRADTRVLSLEQSPPQR